MISLEGLTLATGRHVEAGYILRTFAHYVRDGLIPNLFPEGEREGALSHGRRDAVVLPRRRTATWTPTGDRETLRLLLPMLRDIVEHHLRGTRFGIGVDPADGLLAQGAEGYQLTWMDAKVGDWVVTPRRGKAVEINALWYNALCAAGRAGSRAERRRAARRVSASMPSARARRSTGASGTRRAAISTTSSTAKRRRRSVAAGRTRSSPSRCRHPVLDATRWEPC